MNDKIKEPFQITLVICKAPLDPWEMALQNLFICLLIYLFIYLFI